MRVFTVLLFLCVLNGCAYLPFKKSSENAPASSSDSHIANPTVAPTEQTYPCAATLSIGQCFDEQQAKLKRITLFDLQARIAVKAESRSFSGATHWQHQLERDEIAILSPLGSQVAVISKRPEAVTLNAGEGKIFESKDIETLTEENLGWRLPLSGLSYWILGRPTPRLAEKLEWNPQGRLKKLEQEGWQIEYGEYGYYQSFWLPKKMVMTNPKLTLKIVVQEWKDLPLLNESDLTDASAGSLEATSSTSTQ